MRRLVFSMVLMILPVLVGCNAYNALFTVLGDYYSGGGTTRQEKEYHYEQQIEAWNDYDKYGISP